VLPPELLSFLPLQMVLLVLLPASMAPKTTPAPKGKATRRRRRMATPMLTALRLQP